MKGLRAATAIRLEGLRVRNLTVIWVGIGLAVGFALGLRWHNLLLGAALGSATGLMIAVALRDSKPRSKRPRYGFRDEDRPNVDR
jgi:hypothetical protein